MINKDKRNSVLALYSNEKGIIRAPGKYSGEPVYAPYFWQLGQDGMGENINDGRAFVLRAEDFHLWPELSENGYEIGDTLVLRETEGFVYCN